jgi:hypothetical protein
MTMYYPTRDGYPCMFEDDAGALAAATPPMPEKPQFKFTWPPPVRRAFFAYSASALISVLESRL